MTIMQNRRLTIEENILALGYKTRLIRNLTKLEMLQYIVKFTFSSFITNHWKYSKYWINLDINYESLVALANNTNYTAH